MAWEAPYLMLVLLLLTSGFQIEEPDYEPIQAVKGQGISVKCYYSANYKHEQETWCKEKKPGTCTRLITSLNSQGMTESFPYYLWNNPANSFFIVTMVEVTGNHTGRYWCGTFNGQKIRVIKKFNLVVSSVMPISISGPKDSLSAYNFLVLLLCGLHLTKILVLIVLFIFVTCQAMSHINSMGGAMTATVAPSLTKTPGPMGTAH